MPYVPVDHFHDTPKPERHHRRSSSHNYFSTEKLAGPGAFAPLNNLPRRRSSHNTVTQGLTLDIPPMVQSHPLPEPSPDAAQKRATFSVGGADDSSEEDDSLEEAQEITKMVKATPPPEPRRSPPLAQSHSDSSIPFPTLPRLPSPDSSSASSSPLVRTPSTPIILSNGKPLKPSLKSSYSSSSIPQTVSAHIRSQSAPATPATQTPKNVHFKDNDGLETVRLFDKSGKPASINRNPDETETETEYDSSSSFQLRGYPFPRIPASEAASIVLGPVPATSPIPNPNPPPATNVLLEDITLPSTRPPVLRGSVLVRNITFAKFVAVRFTLDDWQTTSEVTCKYVASLPSLPPPFPQPPKKTEHPSAKSSTSWQWGSPASADWDRFSFSIKLEDLESKLADRTMWLVVRYQANGEGGGEWWDNNAGANYRVAFQKSVAPAPAPSIPPSRTLAFSSPAQVAVPTRTASPPMKSNPGSKALSHPVLSPLALNSRPTFGSFSGSPASRPVPPTYPVPGARTKSKLSLSNYVPPSSPSRPSLELDSDSDDDKDEKENESIRHKRNSLELSPGAIIGGMPASMPSVQLPWPSSADTSAVETPRANGPSKPSSVPFPSSSPMSVPRSMTAPSASTPPADPTYAEFVKQWCFHQSPSPMPSTSASPDRPANLWFTMGAETSGFGAIGRSQSPILASFEAGRA
ncbi:hypothetical protein SISSUDRAFT_1057383 [Sistotremastrum suecicum HHB10207 ss-3]|uniref:CBM21 domain-containing protein n=1 Tax=Sistotremastrum suecicum HHB10207 ss-3 TaxID=1314776 RepID=A0A166IKY4_9AGAM|nr:hypothetical protein SISSUDRAFT_1057383 [Sistotremastrum suecicum HHB10207 ss-3]